MSAAKNAAVARLKELREEFELISNPRAKQFRVEAHARWWDALNEQLKCYLLTRVCLDEWERWHGCAWGGLPENLRIAIGNDTVSLRGELAGLFWK